MQRNPTFNASIFDVFRNDEEVDVAGRINIIVEGPDFIKLSYLNMLRRLSGEEDILFLENIAFAKKKESEQEIAVVNRIWHDKTDGGELYEALRYFLPNAVEPSRPGARWFKWTGREWTGKAKHFCVVLLFIRRILSSDIWLMSRVYLDQLPYRLIPLNELKRELKWIKKAIYKLYPQDPKVNAEHAEKVKKSLHMNNEETLKSFLWFLHTEKFDFINKYNDLRKYSFVFARYRKNLIELDSQLLEEMNKEEREKDEEKQEKYIIDTKNKSKLFGFAKQLVDQLEKKIDGIYIDVSSREKFEKYKGKIYIGGRKYYFQEWPDNMLEIYRNIPDALISNDVSFNTVDNLKYEFKDESVIEIDLIIRSIDEIQGNKTYRKEAFMKSVDHILENNVDTYPDKIYHFGRITSIKRDTDTIEGMNEENIWGYGSLLFALRDYNARSLYKTIAKNKPNLEKFNSDWASFIPGRIRDKQATEYQTYLQGLHEDVTDDILILLDEFLQFSTEVQTKTFEVDKATKYDGKVVLETPNFQLPKETSVRAYKKYNNRNNTITEHKAHLMNPLFDVENKKEEQWVQKFVDNIKENNWEQIVVFYLLGYATVGEMGNNVHYQKPIESPIYRSRLTKNGEGSKFTYTLYEGFLVNAYEQYQILQDILYKLSDSVRDEGKLTNRVVYYAKNLRDYKAYYAYIHKDESKLILKQNAEDSGMVVFKMELYKQSLHGVAFDDPEVTLEKSKTIPKFDQLDDFWFMFSHLRRSTIYWYRVYSNLLSLLYKLGDYDEVIENYLEKYIKDTLEEGLLTKKEKRYVGNRNRFNINLTQEVFLDKVANIVQPLASTLKDGSIKQNIEELTSIVLVKQGTVDEAMEKLKWLEKQKVLHEDNKKEREAIRDKQLDNNVEDEDDEDDGVKLPAGATKIDMLQYPTTSLLKVIRKLNLSTEDGIKITATIDMDQENDTEKRLPVYTSSDDSSDDSANSSDDEYNKPKVVEVFVSFHVILMKGGMEKRKIDTNKISLPTKSIGVQLEDIIKAFILENQLLNEGEKVGKFTSIVVDKSINGTGERRNGRTKKARRASKGV